jgi:uncharacterized Zn-finger protein
MQKIDQELLREKQLKLMEETFRCKFCLRKIKISNKAQHNLVCKKKPVPIVPKSPPPDTPAKEFSCTICNQGFDKKKELNDHLLYHRRGRKKKCETCGKFFKTIDHLRSHRLTHTDRKDFTCDTCNKGFNTKHSLKLHMKTHYFDKKFFCDFCKSGFKFKNEFYLHMKNMKCKKSDQ